MFDEKKAPINLKTVRVMNTSEKVVLISPSSCRVHSFKVILIYIVKSFLFKGPKHDTSQSLITNADLFFFYIKQSLLILKEKALGM